MSLMQRLARMRLKWQALMPTSVSAQAPELGTVRLPGFHQRRIRWILLQRGLRDDNQFGKAALQRSAEVLLRHLEAQAEPCTPRSLDVFDCSQEGGPDLASGAADAFYERFVRRPRPTLIRGLSGMPEELQVDRFLERCAGQPGTMMNLEGATIQGRIGDIQDREEGGRALYLLSDHTFLESFPEARDALPIPHLAAMVRREAPQKIALFASAQEGTGTHMHCEDNYNTFLLLEGRKRFMLVDPNHMLLAYPYLTHTNNFQLSLMPTGEEDPAFPLYRYCPRYQVDLEPGDALFLPPWWYHSVVNLEAKTFAIAMRWPTRRSGEVQGNALFAYLHRAAPRLRAGDKAIHHDSSVEVGTGRARSSWGLTVPET